MTKIPPPYSPSLTVIILYTTQIPNAQRTTHALEESGTESSCSVSRRFKPCGPVPAPFSCRA